MGTIFSYPVINLFSLYHDSNDEDSTNESIISPILTVTGNNDIIFDDTDSHHEIKKNNTNTNCNQEDTIS